MLSCELFPAGMLAGDACGCWVMFGATHVTVTVTAALSALPQPFDTRTQ